jgi:hypothetical protein
MNDEITNLEARLQDLEYKALKQKIGWTAPKPKSESRATTPKPTDDFSAQLTQRGKKFYYRTAAGITQLGPDRSTWPPAARKLMEQSDAVNSRHQRRNGVLVSSPIGPLEFR